MTSAEPVIRCLDVSKAFGPTQALRGVDFAVHPACVHALVGENGAGKTTLVRCIVGELIPDHGLIEVGEPVGLVRQQLSTVPGLTVLENVVFAAEPSRRGIIDWQRARTEVERLCEQLSLPLPLDAHAIALPIAVRQRIEVVRVLYAGARVLLLDEPTALLTPLETEALFSVVDSLVADGYTIVFISHKLREVEAIASSATVLRQGENAAEFDQPPLDPVRLAEAMVGGTTPAVQRSDTILRSNARVGLAFGQPASRVEIPAGQLHGVAGVAGSGQEELVEHLSGVAHHRQFGIVELNGNRVDRTGTGDRRRAGLRVLPADARGSASAVSASLIENVMTSEPPEDLVSRVGFIDAEKARAWAAAILSSGEVRFQDLGQQAGELSGGNLQRLIIARELSSGSVVVAHEPTRGVDVAAASSIRQKLRAYVEEGGVGLVLSSDLDELFEISDVIHVMFSGRVVGSLERDDFTLKRMGQLMGGLVGGAE